MNNIVGVFSQLQGFLQNPTQMLSRMGLPGNAIQNPQQAVQDLLNSGRMTQEQLNQLRQTADQIQRLPQFQQMFRK